MQVRIVRTPLGSPDGGLTIANDEVVVVLDPEIPQVTADALIAAADAVAAASTPDAPE
jgi:hypothetical protein